MSIPEELARREERLAMLAKARAKPEPAPKNALSGRWPITAPAAGAGSPIAALGQ